MLIDAQSLITAGAVLSTVAAFVTLGWKLFQWIDSVKELKQEVSELKDRLDSDIEAVKKMHNSDRDSIQEEQTLIVYGLLACLKGLKEQGCDGPVSEAIDRIEKHINKKAHGQE